MARGDSAQRRHSLAAFGDSHKAAGMEGAAGGRIQGTGHFALQNDALPRFLDEGVGDGYGGEQSPGVRVQGVIIEPLDLQISII